MASCCEDKSYELIALRKSHGRVLWIVLTINAVMFIVEGLAGIKANSTSLLADALDMLGDSLVYGFSLFVLARSARWQAGASLVKGGFMLAFGFGGNGGGNPQGFTSGNPERGDYGGRRCDCSCCKFGVLLPA